MSDETRQQADLKLVERAVNDLIEHFDSVQVFTTRHDEAREDGTVNVSVGRGNWFARVGQVRTWLVKEDEALKREVS